MHTRTPPSMTKEQANDERGIMLESESVRASSSERVRLQHGWLLAPHLQCPHPEAAADLDAMVLSSLSGTLFKYLILQIPGWALAVVIGWVFVRSFDVPLWASIVLVSLWIAKDFALFPYMRHFYESTFIEPRIVGDAGVAVTQLDPHGFVRIHGELWQAEAASGKHIAEGCGVCVRDIRGLLLVVDALPKRYSALVSRATATTRRSEEGVQERPSFDQPR
jgi:membrane protein implicated in regulation of membrane protease activity